MRQIGGIGISEGSEVAIAKAEVRALAVVFEDATAVGDDKLIEAIFSRRRDELRCFRFWQQSIASLKSKLEVNDPITKLVDLAGDSAIRGGMRDEPIRTELRAIDSMIGNGMNRDQALHLVESITAAQVAGFEKNANRKTQ